MTVGAAVSRTEFHRLVHRAGELGYDVFAASDHLGTLGPFTTLATAGCADARMRLRTYVLNVGFWNPALLAREVATLDVLTGGRVELGLGAGHMKSEHDDAGLPWGPLGERIETLEATVIEVRRRLADPGYQPRPAQAAVPVMIGAMSEAGLALAARHAEIVGFAGLRQVPGAEPGTFTVCSAPETAARVEEVRRLAGGRTYRSDVLLQAVVVDAEPVETATRIARKAPGVTVEEVLTNPFVLLAHNPREAADELWRRHESFGFDSFTVHHWNMEALGTVMAAARSSP